MKLQAAVVLLGLASSFSQRAQACGQCNDFAESGNPFAFRRAALPANAMVFISGAVDTSSITVVGDVDGDPFVMPFTVTPSGAADGSAYVSFDWTEAPGTATITSNVGGYTYSVGTSSDVVAADGLNVDVREGGRSDACCDNVAVTVTPTGAVDDDDTTPQVLVMRLSSAAGERVVHVPYNAVGVALGSSIEGCLQNDPVAVDGEAVQAEVSTIDWAGNESAPTRVSFVYRAGVVGGCGFGDDDVGPFGCTQVGASVWVSLAALPLLRRRRVHHTR